MDILPALIKHLTDIGFLTDHLAMPHHAHIPTGIMNKKRKGSGLGSDVIEEKDRGIEKRDTSSGYDLDEIDTTNSGR